MKSSKSVFTSPADIKYHGLINQGATCYLNSVLQVLFMTKDFREAVERYAPQNPECIDHHLKDVFDELLTGKSKTDKIRKKLGIRTVNERRDAAEYFEKILALTSSDASQIFHGELTHKIKCSNCPEENNTDGRFWHLPLELVDSHRGFYSVVDGIKEYFQNSRLSGENQMYCDPCDAKSDATITCAMKHHPDVLTLLLKRFDFDYRYMSYVKNNRVVDVPSSLQIPENQTYELYAFVEHFGDLRGGHYTATIKSQDDERWYNFNDDSVTLLDKQPFQTGNTKNHPFRSWSVHLLFYKKKKTACSNGLCQPANRGHVPDRKGCNKNRQDLWDQKEARKHQIDKRKMMKVEEEGGKEAGAYASAENRGQFSIGTQQAQKCERGNKKPVWKAENQGDSSADRKSQRCSQVKSRAKTPQDTSKNKERIERQSEPRPDGRMTLTEGLSSMKLNESPSPEPQQRRAGNAQEDSESDAAPQSRGDYAKEHKKSKKTHGCLPLFRCFSKNKTF